MHGDWLDFVRKYPFPADYGEEEAPDAVGPTLTIALSISGRPVLPRELTITGADGTVSRYVAVDPPIAEAESS